MTALAAVGAVAGVAVVPAFLADTHTAAAVLGALAAGAAGTAALVWSRHLSGDRVAVQERHRADDVVVERAAVAGDPATARGRRSRRRLLTMLVVAGGAAAAAVAVPLRWLGPRPARALQETPWRRDRRLVDATGRPVTADQLPVGGFLPIYPEGHVDAGDAPAVLLRLPPERAVPSSSGAPGGHVAYSMLCTHMGCPVSLYEQETNVLVCPCHQSVFDVLREGEPIFGPATRALPRLPLAVGDDGFLRATGDFSGVVGPGFWRRP